MAITYQNIILLTVTFIFLCFLVARSDQSVSNAVVDNVTVPIEDVANNKSNETDILLGLKDVLNKVKNRIYPNNPNDDEISPTPTVNGTDSAVDYNESIDETYQTTDIQPKKILKTTPNNWFTVARAGWTDDVNWQPDGITEGDVPDVDPLRQATTDDLKQTTKKAPKSKHQIMAAGQKESGKSDAGEIAKEALTASEGIHFEDNSSTVVTNASDLLNRKTEEQLSAGSNASQESVTKQSEGNHTPDIDVSLEPTQPIFLETAPIVTEASGSDATQTPASGKIETYSQFAERVSAEKKNGGPDVSIATVVKSSPKVKTKNYASQDCGAKLLSSNPGAEFPGHVISRNRDEYMLNRCNLETYFVEMELCESIRCQKFDVANFELFSNVPKNIRLYGSHRYPARDWILIGEFQGEEGNRGVQSFVTDSDKFVKYVKLEVVSHYGSEFYCPLSLFRIFGISEFEAIDHLEDDTDDFEEVDVVTTTQTVKASSWDLNSLVSKVMAVIKRGSISYRSHTEQEDMNSFKSSCRSLPSSFAIQADQCAAQEYLNYILSCYYDEYLLLLRHEAIAATVKNKALCNLLSQGICGTPSVSDEAIYATLCRSSYVCVMLSPKHVLSLCYLAYPSLLQNRSSCEPQGALYISAGPASNESIEYNAAITPNTSQSPQEGIPPVKTAEENLRQDKLRSDHRQLDSVEQGEAALANVGSAEQGPEKELTNGSTSQEAPSRFNLNDDQIRSRPQNASAALPDSSGDTGSSDSKAVSHSSANKESIVVRLSHKIKVLEENMSISSQYLEELSQTYKRQMEEMQRQFNVTIFALNKSSQIAFERDVIHHGLIESLEGRLQSVNRTVETLVDWHDASVRNVFAIHLALLVIEMAVFYAAYRRFCRLLLDKVNRAPCCCKQSLPNGKVPTGGSPKPAMIYRTASDEANLNGFVGRSDEMVGHPHNGLSTRPAGLCGSPYTSAGMEPVRTGHSSKPRVQNLSPATPSEENVGFHNPVDVKQVIPFRVDQRPGYEFSYSNGDFNSPVVTDYYAARSKMLRPEPPFLTQTPFPPFNYEGFQSYLQWYYHQYPLPAPPPVQFDQMNLSQINSGLRSPTPGLGQPISNSELTPPNQNQRNLPHESVMQNLNARFRSHDPTMQDLNPRSRSHDPSPGLAVQNLDSRLSADDVNSGLRSPVLDPAFQTKDMQEFETNIQNQVHQDFASKNKRNKKKKNKSQKPI